MAALNIANRSISLHTGRRLLPAVAAIVAAVTVDAAFAGLEPGVSVATHLPWALTMLTLLVAAAAACRRLPRGVRLP
jgi:hypothetical protein